MSKANIGIKLLFLTQVSAVAKYKTGHYVLEPLGDVRDFVDICSRFSFDSCSLNDSTTLTTFPEYFQLYRQLKQLSGDANGPFVVSTCCEFKSVLETFMNSGGFFVSSHAKLISSNNTTPNCCVMFTKLTGNEVEITSPASLFNSCHVITPEAPSFNKLDVIRLQVSPDLQQILTDTINQTGWTRACVLYKLNFLKMTSVMVSVLSESGIRFWLHSLPDTEDDIASIFTTCYYSMVNTGMNFVLIVDQDTLEDLLLKINTYSRQKGVLAKLGLMSQLLVWTDDVCVKCLESKVQSVSNLSILRRIYQEPNKDSCECENSINEVVTAYWQPMGRQFGTVIRWIANKHIQIYDDVFPNLRFGLNNVTLTATTKEWLPFVIKTTIDGEPQFQGICMDIIAEMSRRINFSYVLVEPPDDQWGVKMSSGNWTGLIAQLANRDVDLMIAPASIQQEREEVMDFVYPFYNDYTTLLLKKPDKSLEKWKFLLNPIDWIVLVCIACSLIFVALLVSFIEKWYLRYRGIDCANKRGLHRFSDSLFYGLGALLNEGGQESPRDLAGRTVAASWWLFTIVIVASYTSALTATLAVEKVNLPFNTIEEMVEQTEYKWGGTHGSYMWMLFEKAKTGVYRKLWKGIEKFVDENPDHLNRYHNVQIARVKDGKYVYLNDKSNSLIEIAKDCTLAKGKQEFLPLNFAIGLQQDSPYRNLFNKHMLEIEETGLLEMWKSKWWPNISNCTQSGPATVKPISIIDVQAGYYLLVIGIVSGCLTFCLEHIVSRYIGVTRGGSGGANDPPF